MNPTEERFWKFLRNNPFCSTYICFAAAIWGRNLPGKVLERHFNLVDKEDYDVRNLELIMKTLFYLNKDSDSLNGFKIEPEEKEYLKVWPEEFWLKQAKHIFQHTSTPSSEKHLNFTQ